jgi:DNA-binding transcriptional ArsR family regulator
MTADLLRHTTVDPYLRRWRSLFGPALGPGGAAIVDLMRSPIVHIGGIVAAHGLCETIDEATELIAATAPDVLRRKVEFLAPFSQPARGIEAFVDGSREEAHRLAGIVANFHRRVVQPQWSLAVREVGTTYAIHQRTLADGGVADFLNRLHALIRWEPPVLSLGRYCADCTPGRCSRHRLVDALYREQVVRLDGRGLTIVPSLFASSPMLRYDETTDLPCVLVYPIRSDWSVLVGDLGRSSSLTRLLGGTRAAALEAIGSGPQSTSSLSRTLGVSIASASEHTAVLRAAGLVATTRDGGSVVHEATAAGLMLLRVSS